MTCLFCALNVVGQVSLSAVRTLVGYHSLSPTDIIQFSRPYLVTRVFAPRKESFFCDVNS
jgi:hypothetical protein